MMNKREEDKSEISQHGEMDLLESLRREINERKLTEEALNRSRKKFQHYFEKAAIGLGASSPDKKFMEVNKRLCQMLGYSRKELIGLTWFDVSHSEDLDKNVELFQQAVGGKIDRYEIDKRFIRKDGSILFIHLSTVCQRKGDGTIDHFLTSYQDITVQKKAEEALKESEERFRSLFENSPVGIYRTTPDGEILMANPALIRMLGYKSFKDLRQRDLRKENNYGPNFPRSRFQQLIESEGEIKGSESAWNRKDGSILYIRESATLVRDKEGKPLYYEGTVEDISDRKIAEVALKESEEKFRSLFENMVEGFAHCKMIYENKQPVDFIYLDINSSFESLTGLKQVLGKKVSEIIPGIQQTDGELLKIYGRVASTGKPERIETYLEALKMWFSISIYSPARDYFVAVFDVINERKRVEQELIKAKEKAEESEKLKSAFLANMSHEIRTPMNGILGFAELLREPKLTGEEQQEYIDIIEKSGERMLTIINDIITISKVEAGQMKVFMCETSLNELNEYIFKFFKPEAEHKGLAFSYSSQLPDKEPVIHTDKEKIYAILINLVKNAFKFTPKGGSVTFGYEVKDSVYEFFVKDTGIGIPPEQTGIIFERFRQVNDSFNRKFEGAGLGLSISKAYIELLGGKIWVESQYKAGSTFYFTIPNWREEKAENTENDLQELKNGTNKLKILIVEDDEISSVLLVKVLKDFGSEILRANNGSLAVEICRNNPDIDLIMMDIQMPETDGYQATKQIRQFNEKVIIIAQTAFALSGDDLKAREAGCNDYIAKPIKRESLGELINKWFK